MGVCMTLMAAATWLEWLRSPANWLVVLQVAAGLGFVIFVHELGHFLVAKACGVKCEKFYLGFDIGGLRLAKFRWGETEYGIGALPLGGYVKMLGQDDNPAAAAAEAQRARLSGDLPPEPVAGLHPAWDPRSYPAQSVGERMAIISAGVIMNVIFAVLMASWAYCLGVKELTCAMSSVRPGGAAWRAGLRTGDEIVAIGGRRNPIFNDLKHGVTVGSVAEGVAFEVRRPGEDSVRTVVLKADTDLGAPTIGVSNPWSLVLLDELPKRLPGSAAAAEPPLAGGDVIEAVDGAAVQTYAELISALSRHAATPVGLTIRRPAKQPDGPAETLTVMLPAQPRRTTGMTMTAGAVTAVQDGSPAATAGIRTGDRIVAIDGEATGDPLTLDARLRKRAGGTVTLRLTRPGEPDIDLPIQPREVTWIDDESNWPGSPVSIAALGVTVAVDPTVAAVEADGPAARAGIVPGERVVHARFIEPDGSDATRGKGIDLSDKAATWPNIAAVLQQTPPGTRLELTVEGPGDASRQVELGTDATDGLFVVDRGLLFEPLSTIVKAGSLPAALRKGGRKTLQDLSLVYGFLRKLTSNQISPRLLGGPIEIAKQAGRSAREGFSSLLLFLTMLSANLAVVNFLPIPVLDGGHMVFLAYEWLRGKPPSEGVVAVLSYLGLALMVTLMMFVFGLDLGLIPRH